MLLQIFYWVLPVSVYSQTGDSVSNTSVMQVSNAAKPEIFTSGFFDIINNGQVNAAARFIRLFIGEQGRFAVPLSLFSGVSANNFQNQMVAGSRTNDHLVNSYINPLSGLINISVDGILYFKRDKRITKTGVIYHLGERVLTGYKTGVVTNPSTGQPINFLNSFASTGLYFQTGAWERSNAKNMGVCWFITRVHTSYSDPSQLQNFLAGVKTNGIYTGYSLGFGIEVTNLANIKLIYYKYVKEPEMNYEQTSYQFSFNYSMK